MVSRQPCGHEGYYTLGFYPVHCRSGWSLRVFYVDGTQTPRQTASLSRRLHSAFPTHPSPFPAVMPPAYLAPNITTLPSCQVLRRQATRQPHPPPTRRSPSPDAVMLCITSSGLPVPLPSAPKGSPLFHCTPEPSQPLASRRDCHGPGIPVFFFVHSGYRATSLCSDAPKPGSLLIASGASQTTAARRLLCPCGLSNLFPPSRQISLRSDCLGRALSQRSPCPARRFALDGTRLRAAASSDGAPGGSRHELRLDCRVPPFFILPRPASGRPRFPRTPGSRAFLSGIALSPPVTS